jgi:signal transduction histidine kinase
MSGQELGNLFTPFFTTKATSQKGTGLGLYVIQRIIERHEGTITASSTYGVGTRFTLRLPAIEEALVHG